MKNTILLFALFALFSYKNKAQTVTDFDGNVYTIVTIGNQEWMGENLKVTHYRNGSAIPNITENTIWNGLTYGAYCDYDNDENNSATYGRLFNWEAVNNSQNIAPTGWHVPEDAEWAILTDYLGGESLAGGKLKETGTTHWQTPNTGATNETGFTALPAGNRYEGGIFDNMGTLGGWWSSSNDLGNRAWRVGVSFDGSNIVRYSGDKIGGFSVRCVKDVGTGIEWLNNPNKIYIYPNPANDKINIDFSYKNELAILKIYDIIGNIVLQKQTEQIENVINISSLENGMYIIEISDTQIIIQKKLIKK